MKKSKKIALWIAGLSITSGILLGILAFALLGFHPKNLSTIHNTLQTYPLEDSFQNISVLSGSCDVEFCIADSETARVVCPETEHVTYDVTTTDGTLTVRQIDNRRWFELVGIYWEDTPYTITVYLPEAELNTIQVQSSSGNISLPDRLSCSTAELHSESGSISCQSDIADQLDIKTVSGDISVSDLSAGNTQLHTTSGEIDLQNTAVHTLSVSSASGEVELEASSMEALNIHSTSGDLELTDVVVSGHLKLETTSGSSALYGIDAKTLTLNSSSGDIFCTLLTPKHIVADTKSGDVLIPYSDSSAELCEVSTNSGDIEIQTAKPAE